MAGYKGKQGRKPKASTIVERERARESSPGPQPEKGRLPNAPEHVRANAVAFGEWKRAGRVLVDGGLLGKGDTTVLAAYCIAYARWVDAEAHLQGVNAEGHVVATVIIRSRFGAFLPSPYLPIANRAMEQTTKLAGELGMTPVSRSRLPQGRAEAKRPRRVAAPLGDGGQDPREALRMIEGGKR